MNNVLIGVAVLPFLGVFVSWFLPRKKETVISFWVLSVLLMHTALLVALTTSWLLQQEAVLFSPFIALYQSKEFTFSLSFSFDHISAVYLWVTDILFILVSWFSRTYLHRDPGFKRFYAMLMLFFLGLNLIILSGNPETVLAGWEVIGFASFILIAHYRERFLPVKNALKVVSLYRLGDVAMLLAIWIAHHLDHHTVDFFHHYGEAHAAPLPSAGLYAVSFLFLLAAMIKSAQFPFSSWLPRAMEGPTTSTAIFYGSLSVHMGLFLLLRTAPLWENLPIFRIVLAVVGLITAFTASWTTRVQHTVKTQIAYASITQMGIMFVEMALGAYHLALIHFAGNAFLRTWQLLVSPSILAYLIKENYFRVAESVASPTSGWRFSLFTLGLMEWKLDRFQYAYLWTPLKNLGKAVTRLPVFAEWIFLGAGLAFTHYLPSMGAAQEEEWQVLLWAVLGFAGLLRSFAHKGDVRFAWVQIALSQWAVAMAIATRDHLLPGQLFIFLGGIVLAMGCGLVVLQYIKHREGAVQLDKFHGFYAHYPKSGWLFLIAGLFMSGFPFTPTFLGIDWLFAHIHPDDFFLVLVAGLNFIILEIAVLRIYARLFMGPDHKTFPELSFRSV